MAGTPDFSGVLLRASEAAAAEIAAAASTDLAVAIALSGDCFCLVGVSNRRLGTNIGPAVAGVAESGS